MTLYFFIKELGKNINNKDIGVIAENTEKYIIFNVQINVKLAGVRNKDGTPAGTRYLQDILGLSSNCFVSIGHFQDIYKTSSSR